MISREPPKLAVWLLLHWASPYRRDSLAGDLLEMYRAGRSRAWYWRQVIAALLHARARSLRSLSRKSLGTALGRLVNALLLAAAIALGIGSLTQADTTQIDTHQSHSP
jgi:hypothetical protein